MNETINWNALRFIMDFVQIVGLFGVAIFAWVTRKSDRNEGDITKNAGRLTTLEKDLNEIDVILRHAPNHDDMEKVHTRISEVKDQVSQINSVVSGMSSTVNAIKESLALLNRVNIKGPNS